MKGFSFLAAFLSSSLAMAAAPIEGWYGNVFGGATWLFDNLHQYRQDLLWDDAQYSWGYHVGGRAGYQANPLRYEGEFTYINADLKSFSIAGFDQENVAGNANASVLMANVYYDFPDMVPAISPFIGVGVGGAFIKSTFFSNSPLFNIAFKSNETVFAWQGTAGLTYNFAENYAINIAYRYLSTTQLSSLGRVYQANLGSVGIVYRFDGNFYK